MTTQFDLFAWADAQPSNVIQAREIFERRSIDVVIAFGDGRLPHINGEIVVLADRRAAKITLVGDLRGAR